MKILCLLKVTITWLLCLPVLCFGAASGDFFYKNFTAIDLKSSDWIQSIAQDHRGIIFAGNNIGTILEYDGTNWRSIQATNGPIRVLKSDAAGRIYVGSFGEFGYIEAAENGKMVYHSLLDKVKARDRDISDVWSIEILGDDIYFRSVERLFRLRNGEITSFRNSYGWFGNMISVDGNLYVSIDYSGILLHMKGDSLVKFFESKEFESVAFGRSADYDKHKKLIGSWGGGVFIFCPSNLNQPGKQVFERIPATASNKNLLRGVEVYSVEKDIFAARTDNGITVFDRKGSELVYLTTKNGLKSSLIETVYSDNNHVLWIGTEKGITRVDISSPISTWYSFNEFTGTTWGIMSYSKTIYFWGFKGIFYLKDDQAVTLHKETYGLTEFREPDHPSKTHLIALNFNSLVEVKNARLNNLLTFPEPLLYQQIYISKQDPGKVYLYCANGLYLIRFKNGRWIWAGNIAGITVGIQSFAEDAQGGLWLVINNNKSIIHLSPVGNSPDSDTVPVFKKELYEYPSGLRPSMWIRCFTVKNQVLFGTEKGLFHFDPGFDRFVPDTTLGKQFADGSHAAYILKEGPDGVIFIAGQLHNRDDIGLCIPREGNSYSWYTRPFIDLAPQMRIYDACFEYDGSIWICSDEGLNRYDPHKDKRIPAKFNTLIREVITGRDSVLTLKPVLPHNFKSIRFSYSAVSYEGEDQNVYQYILAGFDKEWSNWTTASSKEYSNLSEGKYTFKVKGKNIFGMISDEATYQFTILPPWYRNIWAYLAYVAALALLIYGVVLLNLRRLKAANLLLEKSVRERTAEIVRQKEEIISINENLLLQKEELKTALDVLSETHAHLIRSEKMASLGQLIAGIAHEINTPLGAIKASVNDMKTNSSEILKQLPDLIKKLDDHQFSLFLRLINRSTQIVVPANLKEERTYKKELEKELEEKRIPDAVYIADTLADMGIYGDIDPFLSILNGNTQLLTSAYHLSQLMKNSRNIETAIERASRIVLALKNYSHMNNREDKTEANIAESIITVLTFYQNRIKQGIHLTTEFEPLPRIYCYPDELNQVWINLITNAIDAMDGQGELRITVNRENDFVVIRIADSGKGIPLNIQSKIYDAFYSTKPAGSGLGLFIVKEIIDKHGGNISFDSNEGEGTTFTIQLPLITGTIKTQSYEDIKKSDSLR